MLQSRQWHFEARFGRDCAKARSGLRHVTPRKVARGGKTNLGDADGEALGETLGLCEGDVLGLTLGLCEGLTLGEELGDCEGDTDGLWLGLALGLTLGDCDGLALRNRGIMR